MGIFVKTANGIYLLLIGIKTSSFSVCPFSVLDKEMEVLRFSSFPFTLVLLIYHVKKELVRETGIQDS